MKNIRIAYFMVLLVAITVLQGCPVIEECYPQYFHNKSSDTVCVYFAFGSVSAYPDTVIPANPNAISMFVNPNSMLQICNDGIPYSKMLKKLPKDTLSVFIFNVDTLFKYNWNITRAEYKVLRYDLSFNDLESLDNTIPYPPDERMRNMKMYPPFRMNL